MKIILIRMKIVPVLKLEMIMVLLACFMPGRAQREMETLDRGLIAVKTETSDVYIGWRLKGPESDTLGFNLYRIADGGSAQKLNPEPLKGATNFLDTSALEGTVYKYYVVGVEDGIETGTSDTVDVWDQNYITVPLQRPDGGTVPDGSHTYSPNDVSVGDLDGDGQYEIVLKWDPSNAHDNAHSGYTGIVILDGYEMDGTHLWRIDLGINIRAGAHYTQFMVYDLDGDGIAEIVCKTAPGTKDATGNYLKKGPAATANHDLDYRNTDGKILDGPEFLTIFNGNNGQELVTTYYIPDRGAPGDWGDTEGNRVDRFLACVAYLDGQNPSVVMCRGYYRGPLGGRTVLAAWDYRDHVLTHRWTFTAVENGVNHEYTGQGNHSVSVADVDNDGKDEIIYGACAIDDDGTPLWTTGLGHGDAMHVADIQPDRPGLEKWGIHEGFDNPMSALLDARTGEIIWKTANGDVGRGVSADLVADHYGMECWGGTEDLRSATNIKAGILPSSANFVVWWDGDLLRELLDFTQISKYNGGILLSADGCTAINGSKGNPNLQADIFGDWREEVIWGTNDYSHLRIYTTTDLTTYRIKTLMHDPVYRLGIAWQNVAYNQPPHTSFYLGDGMFLPDSLQPPSLPTGVQVTSSPDFIQLDWNENSEADLAGYNIYRSNSEVGIYNLINTVIVKISSYKDTTTVLDSFYYYQVTALDTLGNESKPSVTVMGVSSLRPAWPTGIAVIQGNEAALICWEECKDENVVGYNLYRSIFPGSGYSLVNLSGLITSKNYADSGLSNGTKYYYVVTAVDNAERESLYSDEVSIIPSCRVTLQAEDAIYNDRCFVKDENPGFHGSGYVGFFSRESVLEFNNVHAKNDGLHYLIVRYSLDMTYQKPGVSGLTGNLVINGVSQEYKMEGTGTWTNYVEDTLEVGLVTGFNNQIRFETTGEDYGNVDEISIVNTTGPECTGTGIVQRTIYLNGSISIAPNPFSRQTVILVSPSRSSEISIELYNVLGQKVKTLANHMIIAEPVEFLWNRDDDSGRKVSSGMYFCRIRIGIQQVAVRRILVTGVIE